MKKLLSISLLWLPFLAFSSAHIGDETKKAEQKTYDHSKYCYYADKRFSKGARHLQAKEWKVCTLGKDGDLVWKTI
jgi:hypothetical protein